MEERIRDGAAAAMLHPGRRQISVCVDANAPNTAMNSLVSGEDGGQRNELYLCG